MTKGLSILCKSSILVLLLATAVFAQNAGKISGLITDTQTGEPLIGTNVIVVGTSLGGSTDLDGNYFILNIPAGKYDVRASMVGYEKVIQSGVIVNTGRTTIADFKLKSTALEQEAVTIEATRPDVEREKTSTSEIVRTEDVKQLAGMRDVSDVLGLAADVTDGHFRGGREGEELYTLQGMGIVNPLDNSTGLIPIMSAVEEVEVITSGFGAQYGNAQSGVVNISMKEGKFDKWRSFVDFRTRLPGRKHFGTSVFDPAGNPFLQFFLDSTTWKVSSDEGLAMFTKYVVVGARNRWGRDSAAMVSIGRALWAEGKKNLNRNYWNTMDYSAEFATGGPITENMRAFVALNDRVTWPFLPSEHPDDQRQILGNIVADVGDGATLRLSGALSQNKTNEFPSLNSPPQSAPGYYNWLWDQIFGRQTRTVTNGQTGLRFTKSLGKSTFYEIKLSSLITHRLQGSAPYTNYTLDTMGVTNSGMVAYNITSPGDNFAFGKGGDSYQDQKTQTYSLDGSFTSQVTKNHLINAGVQANFYVIDVNNINALATRQKYTARPVEASLYAQDKIEFEGMIANVGLRVDMWDERVNYSSNLYSPFRLAAIDTTVSAVYNKSAMNKKVPIITRLQPRVGISFPVSVNTVFHLNYGSFMQRPSFQYVLQQTLTTQMKPSVLGNPTLKPQTTYSYDVGVMQGLGEGFTLDVSGYYKDVQNLIQAAQFLDINNLMYTTYINTDYADIRGFRLSLNKRKGGFVANLSYHYSIATGKAAAPGQNVPQFSENGASQTGHVPIKDVLLDFDRTHNAILNLSYSTGENWGFRIGNVYPFANMSISSSTFARSGRPYSGDDASSGVWEFFNKRTPAEYNTNIKMSKRFPNVSGTTITVYAEVLNLFNNRILNYDYLFSTNQTVTINPNVQIYDQYGVDSPNGIRYTNIKSQSSGSVSSYGVDQSFAIYSNEPRSLNIGVSVDF